MRVLAAKIALESLPEGPSLSNIFLRFAQALCSVNAFPRYALIIGFRFWQTQCLDCLISLEITALCFVMIALS